MNPNPNQLRLEKCPAVNLRDEQQLATMFPNTWIANLLHVAARGSADVLAHLPPKADPLPMGLILGWDSQNPTVEVMEIDPRFLRDGDAKQELAAGLRDMILRRRAMEQETYAIALVMPAWMKAVPNQGELHRLSHDGLSNEPEKTEVVIVDIIWQDGQRYLCRQIERSENGIEPPKFGDEWRDLSAGAAMAFNRFWHVIAPSLAAVAYADAVLAAFDEDSKEKGGDSL